jgi:hypothetical protein
MSPNFPQYPPSFEQVKDQLEGSKKVFPLLDPLDDALIYSAQEFCFLSLAKESVIYPRKCAEDKNEAKYFLGDIARIMRLKRTKRRQSFVHSR